MLGLYINSYEFKIAGIIIFGISIWVAVDTPQFLDLFDKVVMTVLMTMLMMMRRRRRTMLMAMTMLMMMMRRRRRRRNE